MLISEPQSKFVKLDDLNLHYLEWGTSGKPPMVMLHGYGDTAWLFKRMGRQFETTHHLFSLDLRAHGQTTEDQPGQHPQIVWIADLEKFLDKLDLREVILVGYSFGGTIAHRYVANHPERIKALCIIDIGIENTSVTFDPNASPERIKASFARAWEGFRRLQLPVLIIRAEYSHLLSLDIAERMAAAIPQAKLVVMEGIDHKIFKRHLEIAEALQSFLESYNLFEPTNKTEA